MADVRALKEQAIEAPLTTVTLPLLAQAFDVLTQAGQGELVEQGIAVKQIQVLLKVHLRYEGTDSALLVAWDTLAMMRSQFEQAYQQRYGFAMQHKALIVEAVSVEAIGQGEMPIAPVAAASAAERTTPLEATTRVSC